MASKYFWPTCVKPLYIQEDMNKAETCGLINGLVYCFFFTITTLVFAGRFWYKETDEIMKKRILYIAIAVIAAAWIIVPIFSKFSNKTLWKGYDESINDLIAQGYTRQEAIRMVQGFGEASGDALLKNVGAVVFAGKQDQKKVVNPNTPKDPNDPKDPNCSLCEVPTNGNYNPIAVPPPSR